jgi:PKD domain
MRQVLVCVVLLLACAPPVHAETYGELGHFGSAGVGPGQFKLTAAPTFGTHAFGVDPTDNTVYVGDEPQKREYRIQKLSGDGEFLAQTPLLKPPNRYGIEGIAVDPAEKRVYMLALERRSETAAIDPNQPAAGTLYAFSTEQSSATLTPAAGVSEGVLTGPEALEAESEVPERALLRPKGIAVDPSTHDVIILGEVEPEAPEKKEPQPLVALQRVHADGSLGERYVDRTTYFGAERTPDSPVVSAKGAVYVALQQAQPDPLTEAPTDELERIPSDFTSTAPPTPFLRFTLRGGFQGEGLPVVEFNSTEPASKGGGLSIAPDGPGGEGTIYTRAHVFLRSGEGGAFYPGVLAFAGADGSELGWTGGQKPGGEGCAIGFAGSIYSALAAGRERSVFVLDPSNARVTEFGPEGKGCPTAQASALSATVNGEPLSPSETVSPGTEVTFSSTLTQANALSVDWDFGDGEAETGGTDEYQHTEVKHSFVRGGELTVTETIHTDNFATPTIVVETKVSVSSVAVPPTAVFEGPLEVTLGAASAPERLVYLEGGGLGLAAGPAGEVATFDGSASFDPNVPGSNGIASYHWEFGDGVSETTATATVTHHYQAVGVYRVQLTVTNALGLTSEPSALTVRVREAPPSVEVKQETEPPKALIALPPPSSEQPAPQPPPIPSAAIAGKSLLASPSGAVRLAITCPAGETSCAGTVTLRTRAAVALPLRSAPARSRGKRRRVAVVTLASGRFTVAGGHQRSVSLQLSALGRSLLARTHTLLARATLLAHDPSGATHTTQTTVLLRNSSGAHVKKSITPGR